MQPLSDERPRALGVATKRLAASAIAVVMVAATILLVRRSCGTSAGTCSRVMSSGAADWCTEEELQTWFAPPLFVVTQRTASTVVTVHDIGRGQTRRINSVLGVVRTPTGLIVASNEGDSVHLVDIPTGVESSFTCERSRQADVEWRAWLVGIDELSVRIAGDACAGHRPSATDGVDRLLGPMGNSTFLGSCTQRPCWVRVSETDSRRKYEVDLVSIERDKDGFRGAFALRNGGAMMRYGSAVCLFDATLAHHCVTKEDGATWDAIADRLRGCETSPPVGCGDETPTLFRRGATGEDGSRSVRYERGAYVLSCLNGASRQLADVSREGARCDEELNCVNWLGNDLVIETPRYTTLTKEATLRRFCGQ
jgi:hypothetical protein